MPGARRPGDPGEPDAADGGAEVREGAREHGVARVEVVRLEELATDVALGGAQTDAAHRLREGLLGGLAELLEREVGRGELAGGCGCGGVLLLRTQPSAQAVHSGGTEAQRGRDVV